MARESDNSKRGILKTPSPQKANAAVKANYLSSAPPPLVEIHKNRFGGPGLDLLGRLLTNGSMSTPWLVLNRKIKSDGDWNWIWLRIKLVLSRSRQPVQPHAKIHTHYLAIAQEARTLADRIRQGPFDLPVFANSLPADIADILVTLAWNADEAAQGVMCEAQTVKRKTRDRQAIFFVRELADYFVDKFGQPPYGTVAAVAKIALQIPITKKFVQSAVVRQTKKKAPSNAAALLPMAAVIARSTKGGH